MATASVAPVRVAGTGLRHHARAVKVVLNRELIRSGRDGKHLAAMLMQALLWLFVMGTGLGSVAPVGADGTDMRTFLFPGVLAMSVILTAMMSAGSVVWDREFGFLREMLVAPVSRTAIVLGKVFGGALAATAQAMVILAFAGLVGVPYTPVLLAALVGDMFLAAFAVAAFGVMVAAHLRRMESFVGVSQMMLMPLLFVSGALFPIGNLPTWLQVVTQVNPLTYTVDPLRRTVFAYVDASPEAAAVFDPGISWGGWPVPVFVELLLVAGSGLVFLAVAVARFRRTD